MQHDAREPEPIEFVSTETLRPEVCEVSWRSFRSRLKGVAWERSTLYLNIDPVPEGAPLALMFDLERVARSVFGTVRVHLADEGNFARAVRWGWSQPAGALFFYLQADWTLDRDVAFADMLAAMDGWDALNLRAYPGDRRQRLCLSPVLIRTEVARELASRMTLDVGPEAQLRRPECRPGGRSLGVGVRSRHWPSDVIVRDIGRPWREEHDIDLKGGTSFTTWERRKWVV
jgi:hypothetical protein